MIHFPHVVITFAGELWALDETKLEQVVALIVRTASGSRASAAELEGYAAARAEDQARITKAQEEAARRSDGKIALLPIYGTIAQRANLAMEFSGGTSTQMLGAAFRSALADGTVSAIVFDIHSPGGTVAGTGELAQEIMDSRGTKPIVAQVNSLAASGAYWLAAAADEIVVTPGGEGGSIGVYRIHKDVTKALENDGVKPTIIRNDASPFKVEDSGIEPLSPDGLDHAKARVNEAFDRMVRSIAAGRGTTLTAVRDRFGKGRVFGAEELVSRGMADRIDTLDATLERFGSGVFNPVARANREAAMARSEAANVLSAKLKAGDQPTAREWEHGLKGLVGLTNSEAERAVRLCLKGTAQGDPGKPTEPSVKRSDLQPLRERVADISSILR